MYAIQGSFYFYPRPPRGGRRYDLGYVFNQNIFLSTPSARRATCSTVSISPVNAISIHALREEGDPNPQITFICDCFISIHALREEGDSRGSLLNGMACLFLSTPSARRATAEENTYTFAMFNFYPRPPRGGRPNNPVKAYNAILYFYPRPPRGGRPSNKVRQIAPAKISIHALREEGDEPATSNVTGSVGISIHALREEGDSVLDLKVPFIAPISIHALREEGDLFCEPLKSSFGHFYPRPPRGGRLITSLPQKYPPGISIHALREEGDVWPGFKCLPYRVISIHALREEGDCKIAQKRAILNVQEG